MAEENKRKSSRSFDLGKKSTRSFDLRKDDMADDVKLPPASEPRQSGSESQNGGKKWLWVVIAVIVVALLAFFLLRGCGKVDDAVVQPATPDPAESESVQPQPAPEAVSPDAATAQSDAAQEQQPESATSQPDEGPAAEPAAEPAEPAVTAEPAQPAPAAKPSAPARSFDGDVEAMALRVIRGDFGNNPDRRQKLGDDYQSIQNRVNELMRQ